MVWLSTLAMFPASCNNPVNLNIRICQWEFHTYYGGDPQRERFVTVLERTHEWSTTVVFGKEMMEDIPCELLPFLLREQPPQRLHPFSPAF